MPFHVAIIGKRDEEALAIHGGARLFAWLWAWYDQLRRHGARPQALLHLSPYRRQRLSALRLRETVAIEVLPNEVCARVKQIRAVPTIVIPDSAFQRSTAREASGSEDMEGQAFVAPSAQCRDAGS